MNKYEITIITKEDEKEKPIKKEIEGLGGKVITVNSVGQRQMVFPIKKETAGYYTVVLFEIDPTKVLELNKKLGLNQEILRHLILVAKAAKIEAPKPIKVEPKIAVKPIEKVEEKPKEVAEKEEEITKPVEKPKEEKKPAKKAVKKIEAPTEPKVSPAAKAIEAEEISSEERLKALDKKLDELLKE
jgi:small subunit ribosomal protein S6